jgi:DNA-binding NtrC family response regulator
VKRRVLIVEDDPTFRHGFVKLVEMEGHEPISAATVADGLKSLDAGPSHLVLDMNLPDGVGTTVLRHVRQHNLPVKVAVLSGSLDMKLLAEAETLRPDAIFTKPPNWEDLLDWIAKSY